MPRPINKDLKYFSGIDGLRAIAVTVVVLYHLAVPGFSGGLLGVGVFFTLSGYLITANLMRSWDKRHNLGLSTFWLRRFRRLVPAVVLTLISVLILTAALERQNLKTTALEALSTMFYVNNWHVIFQEKSYFDNFGGPSPLSHMWSLSVEEQFYLIWPLVLLVLLFVLRHRMLALWATVAISIGSFVWMWNLAVEVGDNTRVYEGTDTRAGGLLLGAVLAIWLSSRRHSGKETLPNIHFANLFGALGLAGIFGMVVLVPDDSMFLYTGGLALLSVATVMVIFAVLHQRSIWTYILGWLPFRWIGERSYGIYLWHMPVIAFLPQAWLEQNKLLGGLITAALSIVLAAMSWTWVEDPIRRHGIVGPIRDWHRARRLDAELNEPAHSPRKVVPIFPTLVSSGAAVVLVSIVAVGATPVALNNGSGSAAVVPQAMALDPADKETAKNTRPAATKKPAAPAKPGNMSCKQVVHVGDSTSIGMFAPGQVNTPEDTAFTTYIDYGAENVVDSVFGARSTTEGWQDPNGGEPYPSAIESVTQLVQEVPKNGTCWVIATGVNDAANISAGATLQHAERIDMMMDLLGPEANVMWAMVVTNTETGHYANSNMQKFNAALKDATKKYPKLRLYDWPAESKPELFGIDDYAHYGPEGNTQRAKRFAAALSVAFPASLNGEPSEQKIVGSGL